MVERKIVDLHVAGSIPVIHPMKKVYCNHCKYKRTTSFSSSFSCFDYCMISFSPPDNSGLMAYLECKDVNKNNDCKKFKRRRWWQF